MNEREMFDAWLIDYGKRMAGKPRFFDRDMFAAWQAGLRTTPDREAIIEECAKVMESRAEEIEATGSHLSLTMGRIYRDEAMNIRKLKTAPNSEKGEKS
jgi:hypothetical protein